MMRDKVYKRYKGKVNMTFSELRRWSMNPASKKASLDRKPINRNLRLLSKPRAQWNKKDIKDAKKTISFISRMRKVKPGRKVHDNLSKRDISLKNWGFNPKK